MTFEERIKELFERPETPYRDKLMFDLYNEIYPKNKEKGLWCYGCRKRVKNKLLRYLEECNTNTNQ